MLLIIYIYASAYVELLSLMNKNSRYPFKFEIIQMKLWGICIFQILHIQTPHKKIQSYTLLMKISVKGSVYFR